MSREVFGRLLAAPTVERGVELTLRYYLGRYLGEVLDQAGHDRQGLPDPADLVRVSEFRWPFEAQLALVVVATPGTVGDAEREPGGYRIAWDVRAAVLADLGDRLETREAAQFYAAAAGAALAHQGVADLGADGLGVRDDDGELVTLEGSSVQWLSETYRQIAPPQAGRALIAGEARVLVRVEDARSLHSVEPVPAPDLPAPGDGTDRGPLDPSATSPVRPSVTVSREPVEES